MIVFLFFLIRNFSSVYKLNEQEIDFNKKINFPLLGTHEIHITINPAKSKNGFVGLENFAGVNRSDNMKTYFSVSTGMNDQYMLSFFVCNMTEIQAVSRAIEVARELREKHQICVVRVKVEYYTRQSFPMSVEDYKKTRTYLAQVKDNFVVTQPALANAFGNEWGVPYFEYHVKVKNYTGSTTYDRLGFEKIVCEIDGGNQNLGVTYNLMSANKNANLTVRLYNIGYCDAEVFRKEIVRKLKDHGYILDTKTEHEFCIYDSNTNLDMGLLAIK